jgi:two-component system sensor histidine kinase NreB
VNNIIRHSKATDISISLSYSDDFLQLQIQDNGTGFILKEKLSESCQINGIHNMQHRAKLINAEFTMDSQIGNGTSITVNTPY